MPSSQLSLPGGGRVGYFLRPMKLSLGNRTHGLATLIMLTLLFLLAGKVSATPPVRLTGGDGSSYEKAVVINNADEMSGVGAEYDYLARHFPGYHLSLQSLRPHEGRSFDVLEFTTAGGKKQTVYFDITSFFGKKK